MTVFARRRLPIITVIAALLVSDTIGSPSSSPPAQRREVFSFATVQRLARERAESPYQKPSDALPAGLAKLGYDQYRDIRFRREHALWRGQALFEVQFFHRGSNFTRKVNISEVVDGQVRPVTYSTSQFDFGAQKPPGDLPPETGYAGFRVHFPLHTPLYKDELIVFLGASYFRVLGRNQGYGLSARGLAINTAGARGEEFPFFSDFWLVKPNPEERNLRIYALLDSESVTGAYQFDIRPGLITQVEVKKELYPRKSIEKLGVAPLTSMFMFGEDTGQRRFDDFRPEVHDSDGLLAQTGAGEWLWRPLVNPRELQVNRFVDQNPRGFGLIQRDREFAHYQDNESRFQSRPSYWIEPLGDWGKGGVELVEIPSEEEIHDNIVAYWVPEAPVEAGKPLRFSYLLSAFSESPRWPPGARAIATRTGSSAIGGYKTSSSEPSRRVVVDFAGGELVGLDRTQPVKAVVTSDGGKVDAVTVERLPDSDVWRVAFRVTGKEKTPVNLRLYLTLYGDALSETWTYTWKP